MLEADQFPAECWSLDSLRHVAAQCSWWPSYGTDSGGKPGLCKLLSDWCRERFCTATLAAPAPDMAAEVARDAELARDWDDPAGILRRLQEAKDGPALWRRPLLALLGWMVLKHAPQHVKLLPPEILEMVDTRALFAERTE